MNAETTTMKKIRTKRAPRATAVRAPTYPPTMLQSPITTATFQTIAPCGAKTRIAARLVAQLASLALAEASRKL